MNRRGSGILLHLTSLASSFGIGDMGPQAYRFADFLSETGQSFWQILPLSPTSLAHGNSPYSTLSAFAGNPLLISPEFLVRDGFLSKPDIDKAPSFSKESVDFLHVTTYKKVLSRLAYRNFQAGEKDSEFDFFCRENSWWLDDYALFRVIQDRSGGKSWNKWPAGIRDRKPKMIKQLGEAMRKQAEEEKFLQYLFFQQWFSLKRYCNERAIQIIGDLPFYVNYDSAAVWANPEIFSLQPNKRPAVVAGIPPDYFSSRGQLWGNPIYRWDILKENGYRWWKERVAHNLRLFDWVRLDHFKGFVDYYEVSAGRRTAVKGAWVKGPREDLFHALLRQFPNLPFIAEDLGVITPEVHALRDRFGFPGMRVLQFAFGNDPLSEEYKPHSYIPNCVAYTGTHDNDTLMGWLYGRKDYSIRKPGEIESERRNAFHYLGVQDRKRKGIHWEFIRLLMMSVANLVIFPMQDLLGLGEEARMNRPATAKGNWEWRLLPGQLTPGMKRNLFEMTRVYGRG